jgi:hypothetical protein
VIRTPILEDKRFLLTLYVITGLFVLLALGKVDPTVAVGAMSALAAGFYVQSQLGQTIRAKVIGGLDPAPADPAPAAVVNNTVESPPAEA